MLKINHSVCKMIVLEFENEMRLFLNIFSPLCYLPGVRNQGLQSWNFCVQSPRRSDIEEIFYRHYCCHLRLLKRLPHPLKMLSLRPDGEDKDPAAIKNRKWMRTFHSTLGAKLVIWVWSLTFWQLFFFKVHFCTFDIPPLELTAQANWAKSPLFISRNSVAHCMKTNQKSLIFVSRIATF